MSMASIGRTRRSLALFLFLLASVVFVRLHPVQAEKPSFRIIAAEFICHPSERSRESMSSSASNATDDGGTVQRNSSAPTQPTHLTIGFQTKGGQRLQYRVTTYFKLLDGFVSQRHTVGLWRAVRTLEQRIGRERAEISRRGQLTIGTDELVPGAAYVFGVIGVAADGTASDEQNFTMTYRSPAQGASFESAGSAGGEDVSLLLLGTGTCYADREYSVTAQVVFCRRRTDYFLRWAVDGLDEPPAAVSMERAETLRVPAGTLTPGRSYGVQVAVRDLQDVVLARTHMRLTVLRRPPSMVLFPSEAVVGIDQPTAIRAYVAGERTGASVRWSCRKEDSDTGQCEDTLDSDDGTDSTSVTFYRTGQYSFGASLQEANVTVEPTEATRVTVRAKVTPSVQVVEWSQYPAVSGEPFRLTVSVSGLVPKCHSAWTVRRAEEGYADFDPMQLPRTKADRRSEDEAAPLGGFYIRDVEENFLSELVDYGNDTIVKDCVLFVPGADPPGGVDAGPDHWKGLLADVRYKFRLDTVCPEPIDDRQQVGAQPEPVESHWTFVLETNGAPRAARMVVTPATNGTALETVFLFIVGIANDSREGDYPLHYSYWYVADGVHINVGSFYEITSAPTVLPFTRNGTALRTYAVVCDSRDACVRVDGPEVTVRAGNEPSEGDVSFALESIESFLSRLNLREGLKTAFELLITLRNRESVRYADTYRRFVAIFRRAVDHVRQVYGETTYLSDTTIQQFVMQARPLLDLEEATNHELFQRLLELMDTHPSSREKRSGGTQPPGAPTGVGMINARLYLMEGLAASSNESVARLTHTRLLNYVHQAAKGYCASAPHHVYVGQLITLDVTRHRTLAEVNFQRLDLPNKGRLRVSPGRTPPFRDAFPETKQFCVGRVYYARDLFVERPAHGPTLDLGFYETFLLSIERGGMWTLVSWGENDHFLWSLDGRQLPNVTCQLWQPDVGWSATDCVTTETPSEEVLCNCTRMAYLRISNETEPPRENTTSTEETTTVEPTDQGASIGSSGATSGSVSPTLEPSSSSPYTWSPSSPVGTTAVDVMTATESDMITLPSRADATTPATGSVRDGEPPAAANGSTLIEHGPSPLQAGHGVKPRPADTLHNRPMEASTVAYTILGALGISTLLMVVLAVAYRRRRGVLSFADELHTVPSRARTQSPHVRYARFQDEHNMAGDNVSTISDVLTI